MSAKKVFISYSRKDREFAEKLVSSLSEKGLDVWFDKHIRSGTEWDEVLEENIKKADHLVIVLSEHSVRSDYVKNEMFFARANKTEVNLFLIEPCELPLVMARMHYIDMPAMGYEVAVNRLVADINHEEVEEGQSADTQLAVGSTKKRKAKFIVLGSLAVVLIAVAIWQFWPDNNPAPPECDDDVGWRKIKDATDPLSFSDYIRTYNNDECKMGDAISKLQDLFIDDGGFILMEDSMSNFFLRSVYKDTTGAYTHNLGKESEGSDKSFPERGDILIVRKEMLVIDPNTLDTMSGQFLKPDDFVQFVEVKRKTGGMMLIRFNFRKSEVAMDDPDENPWDTREYVSKFDRSMITQEMTDSEVWQLIEAQEGDPYEGLLYYLERFEKDGAFFKIALEQFRNLFDQEGFVLYEETATSKGPLLQPYITLEYLNNAQVIYVQKLDRTPRLGDFVIGIGERVAPIYNGVLGEHGDVSVTGEYVNKDRMALIIIDLLSQPELVITDGLGRQFYRVRYRKKG